MGELITNGDFEDGLTGWSVGNGDAQRPYADNIPPYSGTYYLLLQTFASQTFPVTGAGALAVSFTACSYSAGRTVDVSASFDGATTTTTVTPPVGSWGVFALTFEVPAGATTGVLKLTPAGGAARIDTVSAVSSPAGGGQ